MCGPDFSLYEAMSALELMDPKMDEALQEVCVGQLGGGGEEGLSYLCTYKYTGLEMKKKGVTWVSGWACTGVGAIAPATQSQSIIQTCAHRRGKNQKPTPNATHTPPNPTPLSPHHPTACGVRRLPAGPRRAAYGALGWAGGGGGGAAAGARGGLLVIGCCADALGVRVCVWYLYIYVCVCMHTRVCMYAYTHRTSRLNLFSSVPGRC